MAEIWTADCETDPFKRGRKPRPFIWGAYTLGQYREFTDTDEFVDFIADIECVIYAHNGGKFDWHYILHRIPTFEELTVINGRLARFKIGNAEFRDSYNILPVPLSAYKKDDIDYALMEADQRDKPANKKLISEYLKSDCMYLYDLVDNFVRAYGSGLTVAGTALKQWQKISDQKAPSTTKSFYENFAPFYYGGRVQCFESGIINADLKMVDLNSAYPGAMKHQHAWGTGYHTTTALPTTKAYTQRAFIELSCTSHGALPWRDEKGALHFPDDGIRRTYFITGWEFLAGIETKTISDVEIISVTQFSDSIEFGDYVDHFFAQKEAAENGSPEYIFAKLFLNSLYGKWAANPENYEEFKIVPAHHVHSAEVDGYGFCTEVAGNALVSRPLSDEKHRYYNVATAASITGYVRAQLWRAINAVERPLYCDTDSVMCENTGTLELHPTNLGAWDVEAEGSEVAIAGKKLYAFRKSDGKYKTASKGARLTAEEIIRVARGETVKYEAEAPTYSLTTGVRFIHRNIRKNT